MLVAVSAACAAVAGAGSAQAGRPGSWTRVTATNIRNFAEPGLARTGDGVLHVIWHHPAGPLSEDLVHTAISAGGVVGASTVVERGWNALDAQSSLVRTPTGGLALFFSGLRSTSPGDPLSGGQLLAAFSDVSGSSWSVPQFASTAHAYAVSGIAAAVAKDGTFVAAGGDPGNFFHFGVGGPGITYHTGGCCVYDPGIGVDSQAGTVVLGWFSNATNDQGLYTQVITPGGKVGQPAFVPGSATANHASADQPLQRTPVTGRLGRNGVYLAYGAGYPSFTKVNLLRVGGKPRTVANGSGVKDVDLAAAPEGRLWVMWDRAGKYYATRSNRKATHFEPVTKIKPPPNTGSTFGLWGEGSRGSLDLLASAGTVNTVAMWHTQVRPRLSAGKKAKKLKSKARRVTIIVTDAGDPVAGATIKVKKKKLKSNGAGKAKVVLRGHTRAKVTKAGYKGTSIRL